MNVSLESQPALDLCSLLPVWEGECHKVYCWTIAQRSLKL